VITNRNRIKGISRDDKQALDSEVIKLSVTASVNPVSFSESKRAYHGRSGEARATTEVSSDHSSGDTSFNIKERSHERRRVKSLREAVDGNICKNHAQNEDNGTRCFDNPDGRRGTSHHDPPSSGRIPGKVWQGIEDVAFSM